MCISDITTGRNSAQAPSSSTSDRANASASPAIRPTAVASSASKPGAISDESRKRTGAPIMHAPAIVLRKRWPSDTYDMETLLGVVPDWV